MRLILAWFLLLAAPAYGLTPVERKDIAESLGPILCANAATPSALPLALWERGLSDAQIEGRFVERRFGHDASPQTAQRKAKSLARMRRFQGYAYGACEDGRAWALALPAPSPIIRQAGEIHVPASTLDEACETWRADYAKNAGGDSIRLPIHGNKIEIKALDPGILSVSCQPRKPRWQGPVQWYLTPIGTPPTVNVTGSEALKHGKTIEESLLAWINHMRVQSKRAPLVSRLELINEAGILAIDPSLTHNRKLLRAASTTLAGQNLRLIGENRVKGRNVQEMAWLLWHSPRHRDLILNDEAQLVGLTIRKTKEGELAVIVIGNHQSARISKTQRFDQREKESKR